MIVVGIESSAHTFGVGVVTDNEENFILADERVQYIPKHGGIHPRESSRFLAEKAPQILKNAFAKSSLNPLNIDAVAVALGPGLGPCLRVGATIARTLSAYLNKPLVPVNHAVAHVEIGLKLTGLKDPVTVYLSGGNTAIIAYLDKRYRVFGETLDIALGNLLDTFAREAGLGPPYVVGGLHVVDRCAEEGKKILPDFPYVVKGQDIAFSGLLTTALRALKRGVDLNDICLTLREIAYNSVLEVSARCLMHTRKKEIMLVGGVAASPILKDKFIEMAKIYNASIGVVPPQYAVDNGVMIAWTGLLGFKAGLSIDLKSAIVKQRWRIDEVDILWR
ncbi:KEOPS complex N(6)-L-threonylcarbamoyladenine synthase Kae1 [Ignisphaera sp. 4213-co]|uniref:tRNA N6-adenosine threonylcarbamoyltransferase n=1 Tax=Ignisphaera cupida TaxID=3050454 RepID=A0ABD4Z601_9CREN|nr:KEOPS complex N(6)-L-threonylcarbamoyladenine synthase Kae1 [Ignisphaera sp. 4213-co]MDK6028335.1 KEOPS complex N(6)-L-threonylcarbamoyladenine synthase Kae1 [Ignisphaera sp. 4213-co]